MASGSSATKTPNLIAPKLIRPRKPLQPLLTPGTREKALERFAQAGEVAAKAQDLSSRINSGRIQRKVQLSELAKSKLFSQTADSFFATISRGVDRTEEEEDLAIMTRELETSGELAERMKRFAPHSAEMLSLAAQRPKFKTLTANSVTLCNFWQPCVEEVAQPLPASRRIRASASSFASTSSEESECNDKALAPPRTSRGNSTTSSCSAVNLRGPPQPNDLFGAKALARKREKLVDRMNFEQMGESRQLLELYVRCVGSRPEDLSVTVQNGRDQIDRDAQQRGRQISLEASLERKRNSILGMKGEGPGLAEASEGRRPQSGVSMK